MPLGRSSAICWRGRRGAGPRALESVLWAAPGVPWVLTLVSGYTSGTSTWSLSMVPWPGVVNCPVQARPAHGSCGARWQQCLVLCHHCPLSLVLLSYVFLLPSC